MTIREDRNKDRLKADSSAVFWKFRSLDQSAMKFTKNVVFLCQLVYLSLFPAFPYSWIPNYFNWSSRASSSVQPSRMFYHSRASASASRSSACWRPCSENASSKKLSTTSKLLILQLLTMTPAWAWL